MLKSDAVQASVDDAMVKNEDAAEYFFYFQEAIQFASLGLFATSENYFMIAMTHFSAADDDVTVRRAQVLNVIALFSTYMQTVSAFWQEHYYFTHYADAIAKTLIRLSHFNAELHLSLLNLKAEHLNEAERVSVALSAANHIKLLLGLQSRVKDLDPAVSGAAMLDAHITSTLNCYRQLKDQEVPLLREPIDVVPFLSGTQPFIETFGDAFESVFISVNAAKEANRDYEKNNWVPAQRLVEGFERVRVKLSNVSGIKDFSQSMYAVVMEFDRYYLWAFDSGLRSQAIGNKAGEIYSLWSHAMFGFKQHYLDAYHRTQLSMSDLQLFQLQTLLPMWKAHLPLTAHAAKKLSKTLSSIKETLEQSINIQPELASGLCASIFRQDIIALASRSSEFDTKNEIETRLEALIVDITLQLRQEEKKQTLDAPQIAQAAVLNNIENVLKSHFSSAIMHDRHQNLDLNIQAYLNAYLKGKKLDTSSFMELIQKGDTLLKKLELSAKDKCIVEEYWQNMLEEVFLVMLSGVATQHRLNTQLSQQFSKEEQAKYYHVSDFIKLAKLPGLMEKYCPSITQDKTFSDFKTAVGKQKDVQIAATALKLKNVIQSRYVLQEERFFNAPYYQLIKFLLPFISSSENKTPENIELRRTLSRLTFKTGLWDILPSVISPVAEIYKRMNVSYHEIWQDILHKETAESLIPAMYTRMSEPTLRWIPRVYVQNTAHEMSILEGAIVEDPKSAEENPALAFESIFENGEYPEAEPFFTELLSVYQWDQTSQAAEDVSLPLISQAALTTSVLPQIYFLQSYFEKMRKEKESDALHLGTLLQREDFLFFIFMTHSWEIISEFESLPGDASAVNLMKVKHSLELARCTFKICMFRLQVLINTGHMVEKNTFVVRSKILDIFRGVGYLREFLNELNSPYTQAVINETDCFIWALDRYVKSFIFEPTYSSTGGYFNGETERDAFISRIDPYSCNGKSQKKYKDKYAGLLNVPSTFAAVLKTGFYSTSCELIEADFTSVDELLALSMNSHKILPSLYSEEDQKTWLQDSQVRQYCATQMLTIWRQWGLKLGTTFDNVKLERPVHARDKIIRAVHLQIRQNTESVMVYNPVSARLLKQKSAVAPTVGIEQVAKKPTKEEEKERKEQQRLKDVENAKRREEQKQQQEAERKERAMKEKERLERTREKNEERKAREAEAKDKEDQRQRSIEGQRKAQEKQANRVAEMQAAKEAEDARQKEEALRIKQEKEQKKKEERKQKKEVEEAAKAELQRKQAAEQEAAELLRQQKEQEEKQKALDEAEKLDAQVRLMTLGNAKREAEALRLERMARGKQKFEALLLRQETRSRSPRTPVIDNSVQHFFAEELDRASLLYCNLAREATQERVEFLTKVAAIKFKVGS